MHIRARATRAIAAVDMPRIAADPTLLRIEWDRPQTNLSGQPSVQVAEQNED
jgi:hypothetical protein